MFGIPYTYKKPQTITNLKQLATRYSNLRKLHRKYNLTNDPIEKEQILAHRKQLLEKYYNQFISEKQSEKVYGVWLKRRAPKSAEDTKEDKAAGTKKADNLLAVEATEMSQVLNEEVDPTEASDDYVWQQIKEILNNPNSTRNIEYKQQFLAMTYGIEINIHNEHARLAMRQHVGQLTTLLHLMVLRKEWRAAHKVFCTLIRCPKVDVRTLWPLGVEILQQLGLPDLEHMFFEWLEGFLGVLMTLATLKQLTTTTNRLLMVWRMGTKNTSPLYVTTYMWRLLVEGHFTLLLEKLDGLMLMPPYNGDGCYYAMRALANIGACASDSKTTLQITAVMQKVTKDLDQAQAYNFTIPRGEIVAQFELLAENPEELVDKMWNVLEQGTPSKEEEVDEPSLSSSDDEMVKSEGDSDLTDLDSDDDEAPSLVKPEPEFDADEWGEIEDDEDEAASAVSDQDGWGDIDDDPSSDNEEEVEDDES